MIRRYVEGKIEQEHGHARAIEIESAGVRTIYLAGITAMFSAAGEPLPRETGPQFRACVEQLVDILAQQDCRLEDVVTWTIFATEPNSAEEISHITRDFFPSNEFPSGALIGVSHLAMPQICVEILATAVTNATDTADH
jgi:enamine deaminase RidA (YjgF/YER057c/UK114 family)